MRNSLDRALRKYPTATRAVKRLLRPTYHGYRAFVALWKIDTLPWYIAALLALRRPASFKFVEIGVFKGDHAVCIINLAKRFANKIQYVGFDLFEDKDTFFDLHPGDRAKYDKPEQPYWEFQSGQHALAQVHGKLSAVLSEADFALIPGDSTQTVPAHRERLRDATVIYIDGCHDYDVVAQDWDNVRALLQANPAAVVAFDDVIYPGVARLKAEIEQATDLYRVFAIDKYQFVVTSRNAAWRERHLLGLAKGVAETYLRLRGHHLDVVGH